MPSIINGTVVNKPQFTEGNGGDKLVKLSNDWIVSGTKSTDFIHLYVDKQTGEGFVPLCHLNDISIDNNDFAMVAVGTDIHLIIGLSYYQVNHYRINALTVTNVNVNSLSSKFTLENDLTSIGSMTIATNDAGTEIHAAWANTTYEFNNGKNIRYAMGTINASGDVKWLPVEQVTKAEYGYIHESPSIFVGSDGIPVIGVATLGHLFENVQKAGSDVCAINILRRDKSLVMGSYLGSEWSAKTVFKAASSVRQLFPSAMFIPSKINNLPNGRIWMAWQGNGSTSDIRCSYSDDAGKTWIAFQSVSGVNDHTATKVSLTASNANDIYAVYQSKHSTEYTTHVYVSKYTSNAWGSPVKISIGTNDANPSVLFDRTFNLTLTSPLFTVQANSLGSVTFYGAWLSVVASVDEGNIGNRSSKDALLQYSLHSTDTIPAVTEKVNGVTVGTRATVISGENFTVSLTQAQWDSLPLGDAHTLVIDLGGKAFTYTFNKRLPSDASLLDAVRGLSDVKTSISGLKQDAYNVATQVGAEGVTVTDSFQDIINSFTRVPSKKSASGSISIGYGNTATINTLDFKPSLVVYRHGSTDGAGFGMMDDTGFLLANTAFFNTGNNATGGIGTRTGFGINILSNGFILYGLSTTNYSFNWIAFE